MDKESSPQEVVTDDEMDALTFWPNFWSDEKVEAQQHYENMFDHGGES